MFEASLQEHLFENVNSEGHEFFHDISVTMIDKTDGKNPPRRDYYWQHTLKTLAPHSLNFEDEF